MRPRVTRDVMALGVHPPDNRGIARALLVDLALGTISASDKECSLDVVALENIKQFAGIDIWPVVEGKGDFVWLCAMYHV